VLSIQQLEYQREQKIKDDKEATERQAKRDEDIDNQSFYC